MEKQARARIHYIFSLVASLLGASEHKNPFTSGCCGLCQMQRRIADGVLAALVLVIYAPVSLSFLAANDEAQKVGTGFWVSRRAYNYG